MLIGLALVFGIAVGMALHFAMPDRPTRGVALAPAISASVAVVVYTALTWLGLAEDNPWLWVASLAAPILVTGAVVAGLSAARRAHDARERVRLKIA